MKQIKVLEIAPVSDDRRFADQLTYGSNLASHVLSNEIWYQWNGDGWDKCTEEPLIVKTIKELNVQEL